MGKDKKRKITENEKKETMFYYETSGVILIIISAVLILQLGQIGYWLYILFKVLFGDYYFIYVFLMMYIGFYSLFIHKPFNLKNQRFIGFIFMGLGIMIFCHIPIHNYVISKSGNYFSDTWNIYYSFLTLGYGDVLGGGLIGAGIFYLAYVMFGLFGVCLIAVLIIILGFSLFINKSIGELINFTISKLKNVKILTANFNHFFKYEIGPTNNNVNDFFKSKKQIPLKLLNDVDNNIHRNFQIKLSNENKSTINSILNNLKLEYKEVEMIISYNVTTYKYIIFTSFDQNILLKKLKNVIDEKILFGKSNNKVIIQINNNHSQYYSLKSMLESQKILTGNFNIPLGVDSNNKLMEVDFSSSCGIMVFCRNSEIYYMIIINVFISLLVKNPINYYEIYLYDDSDKQNKYSSYFDNIIIKCENCALIDYMLQIKQEVDIRLEKFDEAKVNDVSEYNKLQESEYKNHFLKRNIYFLSIERIIEYKQFEELLFYILNSSKKTGIFVMLSIYQDSISNILLSLFDYKLFLKNNLYNNPYPNTKSLVDDNDGLLIVGTKENRISLPKLTKEEFERIKKYID